MHRVVITDIEPIQAMWLKDQLVRDGLVMHEDFDIVIIDPSAALISNDAGDFLDYTAESMQIA